MYKVPLREVRSGVAQERNPSIPHLTACGQIRCAWCSADYVLVRSSGVVWGNALPGTVRSLPVVVENRKEVAIPSARQHVSSTSTRTMQTLCTGDSYAVKCAW